MSYCAKCSGHGADIHDPDCPERVKVDPPTRELMVRVLAGAIDAAGGFVPEQDDVIELVRRFGVTRAECREALGYAEGDADYLPNPWPVEDP